MAKRLSKGLQPDERSFPWLGDARQDLRAACRSVARRPGGFATAVVLIGLAAAGTATLSSVVYGVLFRPLPWADGDALVSVEETRGGQRGRIPWTITNATYFAWQARHETVETIGAWRVLGRGIGLTGGTDTERVPAAAVTPSLLQVLRANPMLGRSFVDDDVATPTASTAILSHGLWQRAYGGRAEAVGSTIRLDGRPYTVIGVMPPTFAFPDPTVQLWLPMHVMPVLGADGMRQVMIFGALARLRPGVGVSRASAEATARAHETPDLSLAALGLFGADGEIAVTVASARDVATREARPGLLLLLGAVALLFVTAMASVFNVQVARAAQRRREFALRTALGANVSRLARQWMVESLLVGLAGASLGLALAGWLHRFLPGLLPTGFPRVSEVRLDADVLTASVFVTLAASAVSGLLPAWLGRRDAIIDVLAHDALSTVGASGYAASRLRSVVIISQTAVACVLLVSMALLGRSFLNLLRADRGFDPRNVLTARVPLPERSTFAQLETALDEVRARLTAVPGIDEVAFGNALPFVASGGFRGLTIPSPLDTSRTIDVQTAMRTVTPAYFGALRLRVVFGRALADTDAAQAPPVVVVNRTFAAQYLGGDAIGRRLALGLDERTDWEVVGVVEDMRQGGMNNAATALGGVTDPALPEIFFAAAQWQEPVAEFVVVVRTEGDPVVHVPLLRAAFRDVAPPLSLDAVSTMEEHVATSLSLPRLYFGVLSALGVLSLGVAGVGVFGVLATATAQRTREIGVRTALGATAADILRLVAARAATSVAVGVVLGLGIAVVVSKTTASQIYGVSAIDLWSFLAAALVLLAVGALACAVPLARALRVGPLAALKSQ